MLPVAAGGVGCVHSTRHDEGVGVHTGVMMRELGCCRWVACKLLELVRSGFSLGSMGGGRVVHGRAVGAHAAGVMMGAWAACC